MAAGSPPRTPLCVLVCARGVQGFCVFVCKREVLRSSETVRAPSPEIPDPSWRFCDCLQPLTVWSCGRSDSAALPTFESREVLPSATVREVGERVGLLVWRVWAPP